MILKKKMLIKKHESDYEHNKRKGINRSVAEDELNVKITEIFSSM